MHRTVLDQFYRVAFRKRIYRTIDEPKTDLDAWIAEYNQTSTIKNGCIRAAGVFGKTPMQTFPDALPLAQEKLIAP